MKCSIRILNKKLIAIFVSVVLFSLLSPTLSFAFGVGGLQLDSTLNQKLDASIELIGIQEGEASNIVINLAPSAVYDRMGIEKTSVLKKLKFALKNNAQNEPYIHVTTDEILKEPFLNFLVELNWSNGRLLREFTLLLDPPVLLDEKPSAIESPQADIPPTFTVTTDPGLTDIAKSIRPSVIAEEKLEEELVSEDEIVSEEEIVSDINEVFEDIIAKESLKNEDEVVETLSETTEPVKEELTQAPTPTSLVHEKVQKNEILWKIADKMRPENISVEQMMLALQRENQQAFYGDNISFLKAGAVLRIDDTSTLSQISVEDAIAEISRQHQDWLDYRSERLARNAVAAESASAPKHTDQAVKTPESVVETNEDVSKVAKGPRLKLVSPIEDQNNEDAVTQTNAVLEAATEKLSQLHIELAIASEAVEAGKHENEELLNRLSALEEQMSAMQSLIQLKDSELQRLQGSDKVVEQEFLKPIVLDTNSGNEVASTAEDMKHKMKHEQTSLMSDPITIATGIFAIIMLSLLAWFIRGRKTKIVEVEELVYTDEKKKSLDELFPEDADNEIDSETSVIKFNESKPEESEIGLEPLTEISFEHSEMLGENESLLDPVAEADVYLAYEKYEKAETLLQDAIESDPDRQELKLKLLEVYALSRNIQNFDKQAEELFAAIGGSEENTLWQDAQLMAKDIATVSPLFSTEKADIVIEEKTEDVVEEEVNSTEKSESVDWSPEQVTEFDADQGQTAITDTELEIDEASTIEAEEDITPAPLIVSDDELEKAMNSFSESALDKEWDETTGEEVNEIVNEAIENAASFSAKSEDTTNETSSDTTMFLLSDEVGTKLDLAKAYIEMGDQEGAFDLLGEVLEEGTEKQKDEAKSLMESS